MSWRDSHKGLSASQGGGKTHAKASGRVVPLAPPSLPVIFHPSSQGVLALGTSKSSPFQSEVSTKLLCRAVASFLTAAADLFNDFLASLLAVGLLSGVHFVNTNDELSHTQPVSQKGTLPGCLFLQILAVY